MLAGDTLRTDPSPMRRPSAGGRSCCSTPCSTRATGPGLTRRRARRVMTREERAAVDGGHRAAGRTASADWSDGLATLEPLDIIEVRRPVGSLSSSGGGRWWVGPREVRDELAERAPPRGPLRLRVSRSGRAIPRSRSAAGAARSVRPRRRSVPGSRRSRPTIGGRSPPTPTRRRATSTSGSTRSSAVYRALGVR